MTQQKCKSSAPAIVADVAISETDKICLIKKFQRIEGNLDCCATAFAKVCKQYECLWRDKCRATSLD